MIHTRGEREPNRLGEGPFSARERGGDNDGASCAAIIAIARFERWPPSSASTRRIGGHERGARGRTQRIRARCTNEGRVHPTRRRQGASAETTPTRSRARREQRSARGGAEERWARARRDRCDERSAAECESTRSSASRAVWREWLAHAVTKRARLAPALRRDGEGDAHREAERSAQRLDALVNETQDTATASLPCSTLYAAAGQRAKRASDRVVGNDEATRVSERSARGERPDDRERRLSAIASP